MPRARAAQHGAGGELLTDIAAGEDRAAADSKPRRIARRLRAQLSALPGSRAAAALLRALTQDGQLHPGRVTPADDGIVSWDG